MEVSLKSLYICIKDMDRAINFYEEFLNMKVTEKDDIYSVFDIHGFRMGLFNNEKMNEKHILGNSCLPSVEVSSINEALDTLKRLNAKIVFPLTRIKDNYVLEFIDSEGNQVEVTSKKL